jgi:alpha-D-ribose 1-methylphosphonate 5-phosphate C-P lyase
MSVHIRDVGESNRPESHPTQDSKQQHILTEAVGTFAFVDESLINTFRRNIHPVLLGASAVCKYWLPLEECEHLLVHCSIFPREGQKMTPHDALKRLWRGNECAAIDEINFRQTGFEVDAFEIFCNLCWSIERFYLLDPKLVGEIPGG